MRIKHLFLLAAALLAVALHSVAGATRTVDAAPGDALSPMPALVPLAQSEPGNPLTEEYELGYLRDLLNAGRYGAAASVINAVRRVYPDTFNAFIGPMAAAVEANPTDPDLLKVLALLYWADAKDEFAMPLYQAILALDPNDVFAFLFRGSSGLYLGDSIRSSSDFQEAVNLDPENAEVYSIIGSTQQQMGMFPDALIALDQALKLEPGDGRAHYYRGMALMGNQEIEAAQAEFEAALAANPSSADALYDLARTNELLDSPDEAIRDLDLALLVNPGFDLALTFRGALEEWAGERDASARDQMEYMIALHPDVVWGGTLTTGVPAALTINPRMVSVFDFDGEEGQPITVSATSGSAQIDPVILLIAPDQVSPLAASVRPSPGEWNALITDYALPQDGTYYVLVALADALQRGPVTLTLTTP